MLNVGPTELLVVLIFALIVFGPNKLPEMGRSLGRGLREFRKASDEIRNEIQGALNLDGEQERPTFPEEPETTPIPETPSTQNEAPPVESQAQSQDGRETVD